MVALQYTNPKKLIEYLMKLDLANLSVDIREFTKVVLDLGLPSFPCDYDVLEDWIGTIMVVIKDYYDHDNSGANIVINSLYLFAKIRIHVMLGTAPKLQVLYLY